METKKSKKEQKNSISIKVIQKNEQIKKQEEGITLLALVVTIIVLLILAGITISTITGDNGIIKNAITAKEETEIANEREIVEKAVVQAMGNNKRGNIVRNELQEELDKITGKEETLVITDTEEQGYFVKFVNSGRIYKVSIDGNVEYLGKEDELITQAEIIANPESNTTPELIQQIELTVKTPIEIEGAEYTLVYAWNQDKEKAPEDTKFLGTNLTGEGRIRKTTVYSSDTVGGEYYLWVRVVVGEIEREECFGPYMIRDYTTLISTNNEDTTMFLGNSKIQRGLIENINIVTSLSGHSLSDENCWDVSQSQNGMYLAWYEDSDSDGYYEVTIAGEGGVVANSNSKDLFRYIGNNVKNEEVTITGLENLETELTTNMTYMFMECKVEELDLSTFNTKNVTDMKYMFYNCTNLKTLDLNNFDTSKVTSLFSTFQGCSNLEILKVNKWNTSSVVEMGEKAGYWGYGGTFQGCKNLIELDINKWDTSNVVGMGQMFSGCSNLTNLDVSNFNTSNVISMFRMFNACSSLTEIDVTNFNTNNVTSMERMFEDCSDLKEIDVSNFNTSNVTNMCYMFSRCSSLTNLELDNFDTSNVTNMSRMFEGLNLTELDVSNFNTQNVTDMSAMFRSCSQIQTLDLSNFATDKVTNMWYMFYSCKNLKSLNINKFDIQNVTDWTYMFMSVPSTVKITTNQNTKDWILEKFPSYTNIIVVR